MFSYLQLINCFLFYKTFCSLLKLLEKVNFKSDFKEFKGRRLQSEDGS